MKFEPSEDYNGLLIQARGLHSLLETAKATIRIYMKQNDKLERELKSIDKSAIEEERAVNERLTNLLLAAENKIDKLKGR